MIILRLLYGLTAVIAFGFGVAMWVSDWMPSEFNIIATYFVAAVFVGGEAIWGDRWNS